MGEAAAAASKECNKKKKKKKKEVGMRRFKRQSSSIGEGRWVIFAGVNSAPMCSRSRAYLTCGLLKPTFCGINIWSGAKTSRMHRR